MHRQIRMAVGSAFLLTLCHVAGAGTLDGWCYEQFDANTDCELLIGTEHLTIQNNGLIRSAHGKSLQLKLPADFGLSLLRYDLHGNDAYILFEITYGESGGTIVSRVRLDTMSLTWTT